MSKYFYIDAIEQKQVSYTELLQDITHENVYFPYCKCNKYYDIFKNIVLSLIADKEITLLDNDFSDIEITKLLGDVSLLNTVSRVSCSQNMSLETMLQFIRDKAKTWKITLFTSGTTGVPKKISHTIDSIARFVICNERHVNDVWGFAYNPTHMAGLQVFFQALFNNNTIVRLFGMEPECILQQVDKNNITHISATPTFYRMLLPVRMQYSSVQRITSGGEKFDEHLLLEIQTMFPNAKITNVYASTEAGTLFAAQNDVFSVKKELIQKIQIRDNELWLHRSLLGDTHDLQFSGDWYATGDLISIIEQDPLTFRFVSRKNEMINVGGYKVNPEEVEECIRQCLGVRDVFVYGRKNSVLGTIVCCDVVRESETVSELQIRNFLRNRLQEFKIPRITNFVDTLQTTRTGKLSRK